MSLSKQTMQLRVELLKRVIFLFHLLDFFLFGSGELRRHEAHLVDHAELLLQLRLDLLLLSNQHNCVRDLAGLEQGLIHVDHVHY